MLHVFGFTLHLFGLTLHLFGLTLHVFDATLHVLGPTLHLFRALLRSVAGNTWSKAVSRAASPWWVPAFPGFSRVCGS
jgi:hypothetical protein